MVALLATATAQRPTHREMMSLSWFRSGHRVSGAISEAVGSRQRTHHVKGVGEQGQGFDEQSDGQFSNEEDDINSQHNADARRLGPRHGGRLLSADSGWGNDLVGLGRRRSFLSSKSSESWEVASQKKQRGKEDRRAAFKRNHSFDSVMVKKGSRGIFRK